MSSFDSPEFKKLKAEFYGKLKELNFHDAENADGNLRVYHTNTFQKRESFKDMEEIAEYYTWASRMTSFGIFKSRTDEMIWILHSEGKSSQNIADELCIMGQTGVAKAIKRIALYLKNQPDNE